MRTLILSVYVSLLVPAVLVIFYYIYQSHDPHSHSHPTPPIANTDMSVSAIRTNATNTAKSAIIFLHGLGDSGEGWAWFPQVIKQSGMIKSFQDINFVFPNAPVVPITVNGGMRMPAWFDIYEFGNPKARQDVDGILKSIDIVKSLIQEQINTYHIPPEKIIIGGFSQGSAITMATLASLDFKIGGLVALSGFCPITEKVKEIHTQANFDTPVFQGHGDEDPIINYTYGKQLGEFYQQLGFNKWTFNTYHGVPHSTNNQELVDVIKFISDIVDK